MVSYSSDMLYSYLNLESTKTKTGLGTTNEQLYSYLNLESTKTNLDKIKNKFQLYSYLNLESTKTHSATNFGTVSCTVT